MDVLWNSGSVIRIFLHVVVKFCIKSSRVFLGTLEIFTLCLSVMNVLRNSGSVRLNVGRDSFVVFNYLFIVWNLGNISLYHVFSSYGYVCWDIRISLRIVVKFCIKSSRVFFGYLKNIHLMAYFSVLWMCRGILVSAELS